MSQSSQPAIAIVGVGAVLPDAPDATTFWENVKAGRYSIREVPGDRWDPALYYDPDPAKPDKTYSKIGGWVQDWSWDPLAWRLPIPPRVSDAMDRGQKWAIIAARQALQDYGYPERPLDPARTAVIVGNAMAGDDHYTTALRIQSSQILQQLAETSSFGALADAEREALLAELRQRIDEGFPPITEDTMPGELSNIIAGRIAALFDFHGPTFTTDAACASTFPALSAAVQGLQSGHFDAALTGAVDANMNPVSFVKFCKIGALSATGSRPYGEGADGFVMGEGSALFLLKRLADAEHDGDRIYAVIRAIGGASDGRGKGITAPNPVGQRLAIERGWQLAGVTPDEATLIEGHGTSTAVGDRVELETMRDLFAELQLRSPIPIGSVKSNIGHLKSAAGAAGLLKAAFALSEKTLPPTLGCDRLNPGVDPDAVPFAVNTELRPWEVHTPDAVRRAGVSAFGFGGTNFHVVLEEHVPGRSTGRTPVAGGLGAAGGGESTATSLASSADASSLKAPLRGLALVGAESEQELAERLGAIEAEPPSSEAVPFQADLQAPVRLAIDYSDAADLHRKIRSARDALAAGRPAVWRALRARGIHRGQGPAPKVAFLFTGQGSQYVNMGAELRAQEPIVAEIFDEADQILTPLLGQPLSELLFVDPDDVEAVRRCEQSLRQTAVTQPAVLTVDLALVRLLAAYGIEPDMVMGHSLGEYGALVAAGVMSLGSALEAVSARGREMTKVAVADCGLMAAVFAPLDDITRIVAAVDGYVTVANINSNSQAVIGGATQAVQAAVEAIEQAGHRATLLPVSHAFHTSIVAPASEPLQQVLRRLPIGPPRVPVVANVDGELYPMHADAGAEVVDMLGQQIASPVQFVKGLHTLYEAGIRAFVEVGPKKALHGFVEDVLGEHDDVISLFTNHPKLGDVAAFNQALGGLYAAGLGHGRPEPAVASVNARAETSERVRTAEPARTATASPSVPAPVRATTTAAPPAPRPASAPPARPSPSVPAPPSASVPPAPRSPVSTPPSAAPTSRPPSGLGALTPDGYLELGQMFADVLSRGMELVGGSRPTTAACIGVTGAALGLPGTARVFDDDNVERLLRGEQLIGPIPQPLQQAMIDKRITRVVKEREGGAHFETLDSTRESIKLAARLGELDMVEQFGLAADRTASLDIATRLAIGAGVSALRDAGIPLVRHYKRTTTGTSLPEHWRLPASMQDDTGVIFASAFPGYDEYARQSQAFYEERGRRERLAELAEIRRELAAQATDLAALAHLDERIRRLEAEIEERSYHFDSHFLFKVLSMGHCQFAEHIGARGPNTQVNAACASGAQAVTIAHDWIQSGRCRRVIVISGDAVTSDHLMEWIGGGFLASGAAATDERVEDAATPFDRRRHGLVLGAGAASVVLECEAAWRERGIQPIAEIVASQVANSAFHGSRLDVEHIASVVEQVVATAEQRLGLTRDELASRLAFISHETYTPARGGSAQAEVSALRQAFGPSAEKIVVANTKGFTGHPMAAGIEEAAGVKMLETGLVPPVANFREIDPELGLLNLSRGGAYPIEYALRLAAGFGSQIALYLLRRVPTPDGRRPAPTELGFHRRLFDEATWEQWLAEASGYARPAIEVAQATLRIADQGPPSVERQRPVRYSSVPPSFLAGYREPSWTPPPLPALDELEPAASGPTITPAHEPRADAAPAAPPSPDSGPTESVEAKVLAIIADKTGYPVDMLESDLDLEADLGIDTVKQAEMFAAIREAWGVARDDAFQLRDFPTIGHVVRFVLDHAPEASAAGPSGAVVSVPTRPREPQGSAELAVAAPSAVVAPAESVEAKVLAIIADKTGYPVDMLESDLDLEADLGIDTVKQAEMFAAIREAWGVARDDAFQLRDFPTIGHVVRFVLDRAPETPVVGSGGVDVRTPASPPPTRSSVELSSAAAVPLERQSEEAGALATAEPSADDEVQARVLAIIADKTGYPVDMLELDLDLEADLGIDTVKQAEMFAAIREAYGGARDESFQLRDFPTIGHVVRFAIRHRADAAAQAAAGEAANTPAPAAVAAAPGLPVAGDLQAAAAVPRRVPTPVLRPPLELCKATQASLSAPSRVVVMHDQQGAGSALHALLEERGVAVLDLDADVDTAALAAAIESFQREEPIDGLYWLPALDEVGDVADLSLDDWRRALDGRAKGLYASLRTLLASLRRRPGFFLVAATALGGYHGYDDRGASRPLGGAVSGLCKAFHREQPGALVKVVDFDPNEDAAAMAERLVGETLADPGVVEVGYGPAGAQGRSERWTVGLVERAAAGGGTDVELSRDTVFVVTGAAGSIVSAIVADLAQASGGTFYLLDLCPEPDASNPDLQRLDGDRAALKRDVFERLKEGAERVTPVLVEREIAHLERQQAALQAIEAVRRAGGTAHYHEVNLLDAQAVEEVIAELRAEHGRIDVLLHAAGIEISHPLADKEPAEFARVFDVKVDGWFNLMKAVGTMPLGAAVAFSSIAARFGNAGQTDYSAANDLLCKLCSSLRRTRPETRAVAIDWTAWRDIGMASRGSIPQVMERAGIDMLPPAAGIPVIRRELGSADAPRELVIAQSLGVLLDELDDEGGLDVSKLAASRDTALDLEVLGMSQHGELAARCELDPAAPFLRDHQIEGVPVLPGVMGIECFAELCAKLLPERAIVAIEDVEFAAPFKLYRGEPRALELRATFEPDGADVVACCQLVGRRLLHGRSHEQTTIHFRGRVRLGASPAGEPPDRVAIPANGARVAVAGTDLYPDVYFHGPSYQVLRRAWGADDRAIGEMAADLPTDVGPGRRTLMAPRWLELCFQTAGLFELGTRGRLALPQGLERVRLFRAPAAEGEAVRALVVPRSDGRFDATVVDEQGLTRLELVGYRSVELPAAVEPGRLDRVKEAFR